MNRLILFFFAVLMLSAFQCRQEEVVTNDERTASKARTETTDLAKLIAEDADFRGFMKSLTAITERHDAWLASLESDKKAAYLLELKTAIEKHQQIPIRFVTTAEFEQISAQITSLSAKVKERYALAKLSDTEMSDLMNKVLTHAEGNKRSESTCCDAVFESYVACSFAVPVGQSTDPCWRGYLAGSAACGGCHSGY